MTDDADPNAPITPPVRRQTARPGVLKRVPGDGRLTGPPVRPDAPVPATVGESEPPPVPLAEQRSESDTDEVEGPAVPVPDPVQDSSAGPVDVPGPGAPPPVASAAHVPVADANAGSDGPDEADPDHDLEAALKALADNPDDWPVWLLPVIAAVLVIVPAVAALLLP